MVQLEVAARLAASQGRGFTLPSVKMQWYGQVDSVGTVGPKVFWPEPRVDSLVSFDFAAVQHLNVLGGREVFACIDGLLAAAQKLRSALVPGPGTDPGGSNSRRSVED